MTKPVGFEKLWSFSLRTPLRARQPSAQPFQLRIFNMPCGKIFSALLTSLALFATSVYATSGRGMILRTLGGLKISVADNYFQPATWFYDGVRKGSLAPPNKILAESTGA